MRIASRRFTWVQVVPIDRPVTPESAAFCTSAMNASTSDGTAEGSMPAASSSSTLVHTTFERWMLEGTE